MKSSQCVCIRLIILNGTQRVKRHSLPEAFQSHRVFFIIPLKVAKVQYDIEHIESTKIASNHDGEKPKNIIQ